MKKERNYALLSHNTFGIPVRCDTFVEYETIEELRMVLEELRATPNEPFLHIGAGSNLLFLSDYKGTILHSAIKGVEVVEEDEDTVSVCVGAGVVWDDFVAEAVMRGWYGIENLSLIPGEVGASAVQNIGAYGVEVEEVIERVSTIAVADGTERLFSHADCDYGYRQSVFKNALKGQYIVTSVTYRLNKKFCPNYRYVALQREVEQRNLLSTATAEDIRRIVIEVRNAKLPDPKEQGNAGSFFMNPVIKHEKFVDLHGRYPDMPSFPAQNGVKVPAAWLIEQAGWKGKSLARAGVHSKQALVLVNLGDATGAEIQALCQAVQQAVQEKFGILLKPEVNFIST